jgi:rifampicin phosphotransferase
MDDARFSPPGPGRWELDRSHFPGGTTPIVSDLMTEAMPAGTRRVFAELGMPADALDCRFVNGFLYTRLRPLVGADKPQTKTPPTLLLKLVVRVHPEMRRRTRAAARALKDRPWRSVITDWQSGGRSTLQRTNLALQDVSLGQLDDRALVAHVRTLVEHLRSTLEQHFWMHGYDLGPIAMFLSEAKAWGLESKQLLPLLEGASPSTSEPVQLLASLRSMVEASGVAPATLDDVRAISPEADAALTDYLHYRRALLFSQYDLDGRTLGEVPELVLATILAADHQDRSASVAAATAAIRARVPAEDRARFDDLLDGAREAMDLRDDNGPNTAEWPLGLLRLALLEVGRRLVAGQFADEAEQAFELHTDELTADLLSTGGPGREALARRAARRREMALLTPPDTLGPAEAPPPMDALPAPLAALVTMIQVALTELGMAGADRTADPLTGSGVGTRTYRGVARSASTPEEAMEAMEPGDVLVVQCTTPAYNVILSIAGAVVTADGGPLSHAAVLARELGIPAVVGAPGALGIPSGSTVEVDPVAGVVRVVSPIEPVPAST